MFGLSEREMENYKDLVQNFAVTEVAPKIVQGSGFLLKLYPVGDKFAPVLSDLNAMTNDIEIVVTLTATHIAYDYANLQCEMEMDEVDIIKQLHRNYETYVINQFIRYGLGFTEDVVLEIVGSIILELPYLYVQAVEDENFDDDLFLDQKLEAYNTYMNENFLKKDKGSE